MHPVLFTLGPLTVTSYGVALLVSFALGIGIAARRAERLGIAGERILDVGLLVLLTSLLGSRALWLLTHPEAIAEAGGWLRALAPSPAAGRSGVSGLSMQGGVLLAIATAVAYLVWRRVPLWRALDAMAPSVALGEGITRLGCFANGCCHGLVCSGSLCVRFPPDSPAVRLFGDVPVHPSQLYASASALALFALLSWALPRRPFDGAIVCAWLVLASGQRLVVDLFRYYEPSVTLFRVGGWLFTVNSAVACALLVAGVVGWARLSRRRSPPPR